MNEIVKNIKPAAKVKGRVRIPGSKSITHRALLMAALSEGTSEIMNPLFAQDTELTAKALKMLGVDLQWEKDKVRVQSSGERWRQPGEAVFLGNSGTSMRLLPAVAAVGRGIFSFDGTARLRERPVGPIVEALRSLGVEVKCLGEEGFPPMEIHSRGLEGGEVWVDATQSSQFLSALLIAAPCARGDMVVGWKEPVASFPYVNLTLAMMEEWGIDFQWVSDHQIKIRAPQVYLPRQYTVEGDCSSASYFWAAAAITGGDVETCPIRSSSVQGDCHLVSVFERMGCRIFRDDESVRVVGPDVLQPVDMDMNRMPDMVPTLALVAAFAKGRSHIRNVAHLRVKESDRLHVVALELGKLGVPVEELDDGLVIEGGHVRSPAQPLEAHDDHRIAMSFALAGLRVKGVQILGAESVAKSFPGFWELFDELCYGKT